jgi:hypothetical protein
VDCDRDCNFRALVPWKSGRVAILLPLRHGSSPVDVPLGHRQWTTQNKRYRNLTFRRVARNKRYSDVAISLDGRNSTVATTVGFSMSDVFDEKNHAFTICAYACQAEASYEDGCG